MPLTCHSVVSTVPYLWRGLGGSAAQAQFPVVPVSEGPDRIAISGQHQRVVQPAGHLWGEVVKHSTNGRANRLFSESTNDRAIITRYIFFFYSERVDQ